MNFRWMAVSLHLSSPSPGVALLSFGVYMVTTESAGPSRKCLGSVMNFRRMAVGLHLSSPSPGVTLLSFDIYMVTTAITGPSRKCLYSGGW